MTTPGQRATDTSPEIEHRPASTMGNMFVAGDRMFCGTAQPHDGGYWLGMNRVWHFCAGFVERRTAEPHEHTIKLTDHAIQIILSNLRVTAFNYKAAGFPQDYFAVAKVIREIERQAAE